MKGLFPQTAKTGQNVAKQATWLDLTSGKTLNSSVRHSLRCEDGPIPAAVRNVPTESDAPLLLPEENDVAANAAATSGDGGESAEVARHDEGLSKQCQGPDAE